MIGFDAEQVAHDAVLRAAEEASAPGHKVNGKHPPKAKPSIRVTNGDLTRIVDEGEAALIAADLGIYQRSTFIVRPGVVLIEVMDGKKVPGQQILVLGEYGLLEAMTKAASWEKFDGRVKDWVVIDAPVKVVKALRDRVGHWNLPVLAGIIGAPTLRMDGSILSTPGYDRETGLLLDTQGVVFPEIFEEPTKDDAHKALDLLDTLISTFPFVAPADRSVALSAMLTASIRCSLPTAPLHGYNAPVAGSGKSKLVDLCSVMVSGRQAAVIAHGKTEAEFEKRVGSLLLGGERVIAIDNVEEPLGGEFICQVLSQPVVSARILGKSKTPKLPTNVFITANGNNLILIGDVTRRSIICTIDPKCERPELRKFDHDPLELMQRNRGEYLVAALTVLRAFHVAGRPQQKCPLGSFEVWSGWVRDALVWLGKDDPVDTMESARDTDPVRAAIVAVYSQWRTVIGTDKVSVKAIIERATESYPDSWNVHKFRHPDFREALLVVAGAGGAVNSDRLGKWLRSHKDKVVNGVRVVRAGTTDGSATWQMFPVTTSHRSDEGKRKGDR